MKKRLLAWLLCALMIAALLPSFASAEEEQTDSVDEVWFEAEPTPEAVVPEIETEPTPGADAPEI